MLPKGFMKKFAKYLHKLLPKCLKNSTKPIHFEDAIDVVSDLDKSNPSTQEFTEAEIIQYMDECEARKIAANAKAAAAAENNNDLQQHFPCHSFDLITTMQSIEIYPISKRSRFFEQMISKFSRCPLDKLVIMKSFNSADAKHLIGLSFDNENAVMFVYANHPLIKQIANALLKVAKEVEFRWLNLREIQILKNY
uniref:Uncharacterized protein n=1 Tax=Panagrolaimus davidi TaxID=227884 RepID=A0A914QL18_9BILA